ncbi:AraC family transcriptional regulator [Janthinobacterium aquaticum]|uniref:AraC family transcriptional regulator n=1 Tax=Janthinobacterium sp. FT58W TaxID=2654254 RepID=UPI001264D53D|nr:AraC family transcriptional regulator [Janthinobacterium sp. FT58W]KAB8038565.1 helix-turn-helix domain-containing protein [Janthinobacterium sp. FT58W]
MHKSDTRTVSNRIAQHFARAMLADGHDPADFARQTGITEALLAEPGGRINAERHRRMMLYAQHLAPQRGMLEMDVPHWFAQFSSIAHVCFNRPTLREALQELLKLRGLIGEFDFMLMREQGGRVEIDYLSEFCPLGGAMQALANFKLLSLVVRAYDGPRATTFRTGFMGAAPWFAHNVSECFGAPARYHQGRNSLTFDAHKLDQPYAQFNAVLAPHALQHAHAQLQQLHDAQRFSARVEQAIVDLLGAHHGNGASLLPALCDGLAINSWTLRRQLQQEHTSFRALELRAKSRESRRLLRETRLSVAEIGERLGFSSQSAFTRFFRTQFDLPPARYRHDAAGQ